MTTTDLGRPECEQSPEITVPRRTRVDPPHLVAIEGVVSGTPLSESVLQEREPLEIEDLAEPVFPEERVAAGSLETTPPVESVVDDPAALEPEEPTEAMLEAVIGASLDAQREQLQLQVAQLAEHLQKRLREVDRRESLLNAQQAQLEAERRAARLWYQERHQQWQAQQEAWASEREELRQQIRDLKQQLTLQRSVAGAEEADWAARQTALKAWEAELEQKERQLAALAAALEADRNSTLPPGPSRQALAEPLATLQALLKFLEEERQHWDQPRQAHADDPEARRIQDSASRRRLDHQAAAAAADLARERARLTQWQAGLVEQEARLARLREELVQLHRQALEARLAAEHRSASGGPGQPAAQAQVLAEVQRQLAVQYRLEEEALASRRQELLALGKRLLARHQELDRLRAGLRDWLAERQRELQEQAAALLAREEALILQRQQLDERQTAFLTRLRTVQEQVRVLVRQLAATSSPVASDGGESGMALSSAAQ